MKNTLYKLVAAAAFFLGLLSPAAATQYTIKVLWVFTDAGLQAVTDRGDSMMQYAARQIKYANTVYAESGITITLQNAGTYGGNGFYNPPAKSIIDTVEYDYLPPGMPRDIGAVKMAWTNPAIMQARDLAHADIVIIVAEYANIPFSNNTIGDMGGFSGSNCTTNATATAGVTASLSRHVLDVVAHEIAHLLCVEHEDGYWLNFGTHVNTCYQVRDIMRVKPQSFPIPITEWYAHGWLQNAPDGYGDSPGQAMAAMTAGCPAVDTIFTSYVCTPTLPCTLAPSGQSASCAFRLQIFALNPPPPILVSTSEFFEGVNLLTSTGECLDKRVVNRISNPGITVFGIPFGNATHNAAAKMNAKAAEVSAYRP